MRRRTQEERRELLQGLLHGRFQILDTNEKIRYCAFPIMMGGLKQMKKEDVAQIGMVLGDRTKTIGRRVLAGVGPLYSDVVLVHKEDWKLIVAAYNREIKHLEEVKV